MNILNIMFLVCAILWVAFLVGYPVYCKKKNKTTWEKTTYATILNLGACLLNMILLTMKLIK